VKKKNNIGMYLGAAALLFLFIRARKAPAASINLFSNRPNMPVTDSDIKNALQQILNEYGREKTQRLEQLFRWETNHFKSGQFKGSYSPGMEPSPNSNRTFPYGWTSLKNFALANNIPSSQFYVSGPYTEGGTGKQKFFVGFPNLYSSMKFVMYVIGKRGWNFGKWRAFDETIAADYNNKLNTVIPRITNTL
jgi:hypothetical protein